MLRASAQEASRLQGLGVLLLTLSAADLFMTYRLLQAHPMFIEGNPVARWFFYRWNMAGMVGFKFGVIGAVIALGELVERQRPRWGKAVLIVGSIGAAYAFTRGLGFYLGFLAGPAGD